MSERRGNEALAALLAEARWSAAELARAVNTLGTAQGLRLRYDRSSVAHWLAGSRPRRPVPDLAAAALTRRTGRLITPHSTGLAQTTHAPPLVTHIPARREHLVQQLLDLWRQDADPHQRVFLTRTSYSLAALDLSPWAAAPQSAQLKATDAPDVAARLQTHHEMTHTFAGLAERHGSRTIRPLLAAYLADSAAPTLMQPAPGETGQRDLFTATAQLTHLLAGMADDSGHHGLAQRYYLSALHLTRAVDDARQYAITLRAMSAHALRLRLPQQALHLAETAVAVLGSGDDGAAQAFLLTQRAHANASTGRAQEARADLHAAERHHERASSTPGPFDAYPRAALDYQRYQTLIALRDDSQALTALEVSAHHRPVAERRATALTQARLAETHLAQGRLDEALPHARSFLSAYPHLHSAHVDTAHQHLDYALAQYPGQPQAIALREQVRNLIRLAPPST
ncbi:hypothetical protein [Streptomyces sp. cg35]|uniref:hypothetical protein n=1 Tax=Streptomyces sp. cg35 TaxID=3421650 RepID=UPI003D175930